MSKANLTNNTPDKLYGMRVPENLTREQITQLGHLAAALGVEIVPIDPGTEAHAAVGELVTAKAAARQARGETVAAGHMPAFNRLQQTVDKFGTYRRGGGLVNNPFPPISEHELNSYIVQGYNSVTHLLASSPPNERYTMRVLRRTTLHEGTVVTAEVDTYRFNMPDHRDTYEITSAGGTRTTQYYEEKGISRWKRHELQDVTDDMIRPVQPQDILKLSEVMQFGPTVLEHWSEGSEHWAASRM